MRSDANEIALRAIASILAGAKPLEFDIDGTRVTCSPSPAKQVPWPTGNRELPATGTWPRAVNIGCVWEGGECVLRFEAAIVSGSRYAQDIGATVLLADRPQQRIVWRNFGTPIRKRTEDGPWRVKLDLSCRKSIPPELSRRITEAEEKLLEQSRIPTLGGAGADGGSVMIPSGEVTPSPEEVFKRFVHVALLKLDFIDLDPRAKERGKPLIDISRWGIDRNALIKADAAVVEAKPSGNDDDDDIEAERGEIPLNLILYGPPGTGKTFELRRTYFPRFSRNPSADYTFITFHQSYGYEDLLEGIRPHVHGENGEGGGRLAYRLEDGVFKRAVQAALELAGWKGTIDAFCQLRPQERQQKLENAPPYAVFIDEINRGNVARIFGELITLLEPDKRLGAEHELMVTLPYSRTRFGVPTNLHVIGTMNTADRSVEALDAALRRRFEFQELSPDPSLLQFERKMEGNVDLEQMLRTMNHRIEKLLDRDHCLGHAYFLGLQDDPTLAALKRVFRNKVLPLLKEHFFGDWGKIGLVLGSAFVKRKDGGAVVFADFSHDDRDTLESRATFEVIDPETLTDVDFRSIYQHANER